MSIRRKLTTFNYAANRLTYSSETNGEKPIALKSEQSEEYLLSDFCGLELVI